jgi:hypothetical protein
MALAQMGKAQVLGTENGEPQSEQAHQANKSNRLAAFLNQ